MILKTLASRYYQMYLEPAEGMSESEVYKDIVLRGKKPAQAKAGIPAGFHGSAGDRMFTVKTPAGTPEIIYLADRSDFERIIRILADRCENTAVPPTMGACTIFGITNWRKIEKHKRDFKKNGGSDFGWIHEFRTFTSEDRNFQDTLIIVSRGGYSGITAEQAGFEEQQWIEYSLRIRAYHECTHFVCRNLYPDTVDVLWDEILADCIGLCAAFGTYDIRLARMFLGIAPDGSYRKGRLENYFPAGTSMTACADTAAGLIQNLSERVSAGQIDKNSDDALFSLACRLEQEHVSL